MKPAADLDPRDVLRTLARRLGGREAREFPLDEAPAGYLAEPVPAPAAPCSGAAGSAARLATGDGFTFTTAEPAPGEWTVLGTLAAESRLDAHGLPLAGGASPPGEHEHGVWRVEAGARLPGTADRVVPIAWTAIVGPRRIRIERLPAPGAGLEEPGAGRAPDVAAPRGAHLDARLRSLLGELGAGTVRLVPPFEVAFATVGDELIDPRAPLANGHRHDLTAPWLEEALARLGLRPVPLGILADSPAAVRDAILHARGRRIEILVLAGGLGEGVTDRTSESLGRFEVDVFLEGAGLEGAARLLHARADGIDLVGLGGLPLEAAAGFDLFLGPALLARLGAPKERWDWSLERWPLAPAEPGRSAGASAAGEPPWLARPAALIAGSPGERRVRILDLASPFLPVAPGQEGWAVLPRAAGGGPAWAHFAPRFA